MGDQTTAIQILSHAIQCAEEREDSVETITVGTLKVALENVKKREGHILSLLGEIAKSSSLLDKYEGQMSELRSMLRDVVGKLIDK